MPEPKANVSSNVFDEMTQRNGEFCLPVLLDIKHSGIVWEEGSVQQNGHLRLVCNSQAIKYKESSTEPAYTYEPCEFSYKMPKEDGKTKSNASITISCIDSRLIEIIRGVTEGVKCRIIALFTKTKTENNSYRYIFSKLYGKEFEMGAVSWDGVQAQWALEPDSTLSIAFPKDKGSSFRCPSIAEGS